MHIRIGLILELTSEEPAMGHCELSCFCHHPHAAQRSRCNHHFRSKKTHELAAFDTECLRHGDYQRMVLLRADHGKANSSIAARRLNHRLPRLQVTGALGGLNDPERQTIFDRAEGIECFDFYIEIYVWRCELIDFDDRSMSNRLKNILELACHAIPRR